MLLLFVSWTYIRIIWDEAIKVNLDKSERLQNRGAESDGLVEIKDEIYSSVTAGIIQLQIGVHRLLFIDLLYIYAYSCPYSL